MFQKNISDLRGSRERNTVSPCFCHSEASTDQFNCTITSSEVCPCLSCVRQSFLLISQLQLNASARNDLLHGRQIPQVAYLFTPLCMWPPQLAPAACLLVALSPSLILQNLHSQLLQKSLQGNKLDQQLHYLFLTSAHSIIQFRLRHSISKLDTSRF